MDRRRHTIPGLSVILNDTIKQGRNSHFIRAHMRAGMMAYAKPDSRTRQSELAGGLTMNADSRGVLLLRGSGCLFQPIAGEDPQQQDVVYVRSGYFRQNE